MNHDLQQLEAYRQLMEEKLEEFLPLHNQPYDEVVQAMRYSVLGGGKRIRGILLLEFCRLSGGDLEDAVPFACAIEMIHAYSLIHDDLPCMDNDDLRRGKPSCHKAFGEATALLAGDALLTKAFETAMTSPLWQKQPQAAWICLKLLADFAGTDGMIGGQVIDLALETSNSNQADPALVQKMYRLKTCALIQSACTIGVAAAGGETELAKAYGENLGMAFQLVDDILDVTGTVEELGKPIGSDEENKKCTLLSIYGMEQTVRMANDYTDRALNILEQFEDSDFLKELTGQLLLRKK